MISREIVEGLRCDAQRRIYRLLELKEISTTRLHQQLLELSLDVDNLAGAARGAVEIAA